jgi:hypothetical protein
MQGQRLLPSSNMAAFEHKRGDFSEYFPDMLLAIARYYV